VYSARKKAEKAEGAWSMVSEILKAYPEMGKGSLNK
jgi:hypothetical protein